MQPIQNKRKRNMSPSDASKHRRKGLASLFLLFALIQVSNAEVTQHIALSAGTIGFGVKYSIYYHRFGIDAGLPLYFAFDENKNGDTTTTTSEFRGDIYCSVNFIALRKQNYDLDVGIAVLSNLKYLDQEKRFHGVDTSTSPELQSDPQIGPSLEYIRKNANNEKIISVQLFPIGYYPKERSLIRMTASIQLNYYVKRIGQ
jgi:hypothetical protein